MNLKLLAALLLPAMALANTPLTQDQRDALVSRREEIRKWAIVCPPGEFEGTYSHSEGMCHQGDATMFTGLSCLAAELAGDTETANARCREVELAQSDDGRWTRGPIWANRDYAPWEPTASDLSRDQTRGIIAYLLAKGKVSTNLVENATAVARVSSWLNWITDHDNKICVEDANSCGLGYGTYNLYYNGFRLTGALPSRDDGRSLVRSMYRSEWYLNFGFEGEVRLLLWTEPYLREKWYPLHIKASSVLLYRVMNLNPDGSVRNRSIARKLGRVSRTIHRMNPDNALYDFFRNGNRPSLVAKVLDRCSGEKNDGIWGGLHDWSWQRNTEEKAWERSDGHDCVYMINLMLAKDAGKLEW